MAPGRKRKLLKTSLGSSREAVWVPTSPGKSNAVATNGDTRAVGVDFFGADFVDHFGVSDFFAVVCGDIFEADDEEGVGAFDAFARAVGRGPNALAEPAEFVGV